MLCLDTWPVWTPLNFIILYDPTPWKWSPPSPFLPLSYPGVPKTYPPNDLSLRGAGTLCRKDGSMIWFFLGSKKIWFYLLGLPTNVRVTKWCHDGLHMCSWVMTVTLVDSIVTVIYTNIYTVRSFILSAGKVKKNEKINIEEKLRKIYRDEQTKM